MDCKTNSDYTDGINCHVYNSLNCKGCCSGGSSSPAIDNYHDRFSQAEEFSEGSKNYGVDNHQYPIGICACCKDPPDQPFPNSCQNFGRPVLVYEIPTPKFEGTSTHQRDFGPKPVPVKELPPWHPILKDRWKSLDVPSLNKSTYQSDFTPCVATQECRKPVYLAPRERKDHCQELSETFNTWRKTSKGPRETHEVCDKPLLAKTAVVFKEPVPSSEHHSHEDYLYRSGNNVKQLHGPECEKHCYSAPLMCHVRSPNSHGERNHVVQDLDDGMIHGKRNVNDYDGAKIFERRDVVNDHNGTKIFDKQNVVHDHDDGMIYDKREYNTTQYGGGDSNFANPNEHYHRQTLLNCEDIDIPLSQRKGDCSTQMNLHEGLVKADESKQLNQDKIFQTDNVNRHYCQDYAKYPIKPVADTCVTMKHPAGDGHDYFSQSERQYLPSKSSKAIKNVHFAKEPEVYCGSPTPRKSEIYHSGRPSADAQNFVKTSCFSNKCPTNSNTFTLCKDVTDRHPKFWWKNINCQLQRKGVEVMSVPRDVAKPSCPSYDTTHKSDYTEPCQENYRQSSSDSKTFIEECGCTGKTTEKFLLPQFERGGLI